LRILQSWHDGRCVSLRQVARRGHPDGRQPQQQRGDAVRQGDLRTRARLVARAIAKRAQGQTDECGLHEQRRRRGGDRGHQHLLGPAERVRMQRVAQIAARGERQQRRDELRSEQALRSGAARAGQCERGAGPERGRQDMQGGGEDQGVLHGRERQCRRFTVHAV